MLWPVIVAMLAADAGDSRAATPPAETTRLWFTEDSLGARLCDFIAGAGASVDYCCYNSSRPDVTLALISARQRGVAVRVITDNTRLDDQWVAYLRGSSITVWSDSVSSNSAAYMHNKFLIRDAADADTADDRLWVASYNPNLGETFADHAFEFANVQLGRAYIAEFNQMWGSDGPTPRPDSAKFHVAKTDRLLTHDYLVGGFPARLFFAPQDHVVETLTGLVERTQREVLFGVFAYTWTDMAEGMVSRRNGGAVVAGIMDRSSANDPSSVFRYLRQNHIPVIYDSSLTIHEKTMVLDSAWAVTGSANWSANANNSNDENTLILSAPSLVNRLHAEIVRRYLAAGGTWPPGIEEPQPPAAHGSRPTATIVRGILRMQVDGSWQSVNRLELLDISGRPVLSRPLVRSAAGPLSVDVSRLSPGIYFLAVSPAAGWQRLVVAR